MNARWESARALARSRAWVTPLTADARTVSFDAGAANARCATVHRIEDLLDG
jgi:hypothetical protein